MYTNCCPGNFSSCSLGSPLRYPGSSCISSYPSNLVYSTDLCSPSICPLGSSLYRGCQETCYKPSSCQTSCVVSNPCQTSCYCPRTSILCSPCQPTDTTLDCGTRSTCSLGYGSRSCFSLGCGTSGFRSLDCGIRSFPLLGYRCGFYCPPYFASRTC
ncbi:keratin-associated protein 13-1-like [Choloepus didactylus]|uniref:keratin-associated protein 13-1-like n=1 Tax=Choloepus didactylus TaxID=27675 RepID=UPI0018A049D8|nr:keratin-associated protein 13-1-like [Choloepus didactylus]